MLVLMSTILFINTQFSVCKTNGNHHERLVYRGLKPIDRSYYMNTSFKILNYNGVLLKKRSTNESHPKWTLIANKHFMYLLDKTLNYIKIDNLNIFVDQKFGSGFIYNVSFLADNFIT